MSERARVWRRIRLIKQTDSGSCGAVCLAMVLRSWRREADLDSLKAECSRDASGTSMARLAETARRHGMHAVGVRMERNSLDNLPAGSILHWHPAHFVVLANRRRDRFRIADPIRGWMWLSKAEVEAWFTGTALILSPPDTEVLGGTRIA